MLIDNLNKMMQTPFKINITFLDYLQDNIEFFFKDDHPLRYKEKRTKLEEKEYQSYVSE